MSRLKHTRRRVDVIKISSATKYLKPKQSFIPGTFSYFFKLEIFQPHTRVSVYDLSRILYCCPATALKHMRQVQKKYNRPPFNFVSVKDLCAYNMFDEEDLQQYFFYEEARAFYNRVDKLISK